MNKLTKRDETIMQRKALKEDSMKKKSNLKRNYNIEISVEIGLERGLGEKKLTQERWKGVALNRGLGEKRINLREMGRSYT
jgi:hypothetical protein